MFFSYGKQVALFPFAQMDVHNSTAQKQGYTNPGQDEAEPKVSCAQVPGVFKDFFVVQSVNKCGGEVVETWERKWKTSVKRNSKEQLE